MLKILVGISLTLNLTIAVFANNKEEYETSIFSHLFRNEHEIDLGYVNRRRFPGGKKDRIALIRAKCIIKNVFLRTVEEYNELVEYFKKYNINSLKGITDVKHFGQILKLQLKYKEEKRKKIKSNLSGWFKYVKSKEFRNKCKEEKNRELNSWKSCLNFSLKNSKNKDEKLKQKKDIKIIEEKIEKIEEDLKDLKKSTYLRSSVFKEFAKKEKGALNADLKTLNLEITHIKQILNNKRILEISRRNFAKYVKEADKDEKSNFDKDIKKIIKGEKVVGVSIKMPKEKTNKKTKSKIKNLKKKGNSYKIKNSLKKVAIKD